MAKLKCAFKDTRNDTTNDAKRFSSPSDFHTVHVELLKSRREKEFDHKLDSGRKTRRLSVFYLIPPWGRYTYRDKNTLKSELKESGEALGFSAQKILALHFKEQYSDTPVSGGRAMLHKGSAGVLCHMMKTLSLQIGQMDTNYDSMLFY